MRMKIFGKRAFQAERRHVPRPRGESVSGGQCDGAERMRGKWRGRWEGGDVPITSNL